MGWNVNDLQELVKSKLAGYKFIIVSNREPYIHIYMGDEIKCIKPASGLTVALDPVMKACGGTWIAYGSGDADKVAADKEGRVAVPSENPSYSLRRVWLTKEEEDGYYSGFSNEALWPLCHIVYARPKFDDHDWQIYKKVNLLFADAVLKEIGDSKAFVFIQDYHLTLLSRLIKEVKPDTITAQFWHIPWPNPEAFRICPWKEEILEGLLGNDLLGFHINYHRMNFMQTVERLLEARVDYDKYSVVRNNRTTLIRPFPISVDFDQLSAHSDNNRISEEMQRISKEYNLAPLYVGVGLDRIDYTKGIPERLLALDKFLEKYPKYHKKIVFFQLSEPSRIHIKKYRELNAEIDDLVTRINWKYQQQNWKPIIFLSGHLSQDTIMAFRKLANFFIVSSLHDGMNLVAKEFVASRTDEDGVLILSRFTGAARELTDAILVNPYAIEEIADAVNTALTMSHEQRSKKMHKLREIVHNHTIYNWAGEIIKELTSI
jgi:alpha,alpha-trehalose-phosphate synthase [UDP-forming]